MRALARFLRRVADRIDAPVVPSAPTAPASEPGDQMRHAQRFCDDLMLRRALRDSLRRYSPTEQPGQA